MLMSAMDGPIACQMGVFSTDERLKYEATRAKIEARVTRIVEIERGYELHLPGDDTMLALVASWIAMERRCCPFFEFAIAIGGAEGSMRVALMGGVQVKPFLEAELGLRTLPPARLVRRVDG
jgi:hypothetical protein